MTESEYEFHEHTPPAPISYETARAMVGEMYSYMQEERRELFLDEYMLWNFPELKPRPPSPPLIYYDDELMPPPEGMHLMSKVTKDENPYELNVEEFHKTLPKEMRPTIYLECESMAEISAKIDVIIGRVYIDQEAQEVWVIEGLDHLHIEKVAEWHIVEDAQEPVAVSIFHVLLIPRYVSAEYFDDIEPEESDEAN